jgi:hypothetical protein
MEALNSAFSLHSITDDETATLNAMLNCQKTPTGRVLLMPTHHISHQGDMMGFRYDCCATTSGDALPISRTMFSGHTASECMDDDAAIMRLIADPAQNRIKMAEFLEEIKANYNPPDLMCIPDNAATISQAGVMHATDLRSVDCKPWTPELPETIGLYHAYMRGFNRDARVHKLFIVCSGGCPKASDQFCNMVIDAAEKCTATEMAESEEAWWLRRTCQRARCRLIKMLADKFEVKVQCVDDVLAYSSHSSRSSHSSHSTPTDELMAVPMTDTVEHDISKKGGTVSVYNSCVDTTRITNGILCQMHPSEGYWMFRGAPRGAVVNGAMFGSTSVCGAFPTRSPHIHIAQSARYPSLLVQDGKEIVRVGGKTPAKHYMCFDEAFFKNLEKMQWNRDNGFVELIPVVVGM